MKRRRTTPDLSLEADPELLVEPDLHGGMLLQQAEDEVDRGEQHAAPAASATTRHGDSDMMMYSFFFFFFAGRTAAAQVSSGASGVVRVGVDVCVCA